MSNVLVDTSSLTAIGDAIRNKNGSTVKYKPSEMANAIANIKNETYVESNDAWGIVINQQENETVTAKPVALVKTEGDRYRSKLSLELGVSAYTQYIPGQITQSFDTANKNFVIDITPAIPIAGMVTEDGWGKVYIKDSNFYDNENYYGSPLLDLSGNILVAGAQTNNFINNFDSKNSLLKYKDNFTIKVAESFLNKCSNLTSVDLPNLTTTGNDFLRNCSNLTSVNLPNLTTTGDFFIKNCSNLTSIDLPNLTTTGTYCIQNCSNLTSVNLPNLTTTGNELLADCSNLTSIDLPNLTTTGNYFMQSCDSLTSIDLPNLTTTGNSFMSFCDSLTSVNLPNLTTTENYFIEHCEKLTSVNLPNLTTTGNKFLYGCYRLTSVTVKKETPPTTTSTTSLSATLYVPKAYVTAYSKSKFGKLFKSIVGI